MTDPSTHCVSSKTYCPRLSEWVRTLDNHNTVRSGSKMENIKWPWTNKKKRRKKRLPHHRFTQSGGLSANPIRQVDSLGQPNLSYGNGFPQTLSRLYPILQPDLSPRGSIWTMRPGFRCSHMVSGPWTCLDTPHPRCFYIRPSLGARLFFLSFFLSLFCFTFCSSPDYFFLSHR